MRDVLIRTSASVEIYRTGSKLYYRDFPITRDFFPSSNCVAKMNTIAQPPQLKKLSTSKRFLGVFLGLAGAGATNLALGYSGFSFYSRKTTFVPYDTSSPDLATPTARKHNPHGNAPVCIDHAVKTIPLSQLKTRDQAQLTTDFCRGVWSGFGYAYQRRYLEKKYRALDGRKDSLWDRKELAESEYPVGTKITDHFEVLEHSNEKVCWETLDVGAQRTAC